MFSWEFWEIFKNTSFLENLEIATSLIWKLMQTIFLIFWKRRDISFWNFDHLTIMETAVLTVVFLPLRLIMNFEFCFLDGFTWFGVHGLFGVDEIWFTTSPSEPVWVISLVLLGSNTWSWWPFRCKWTLITYIIVRAFVRVNSLVSLDSTIWIWWTVWCKWTLISHIFVRALVRVIWLI